MIESNSLSVVVWAVDIAVRGVEIVALKEGPHKVVIRDGLLLGIVKPDRRARRDRRDVEAEDAAPADSVVGQHRRSLLADLAVAAAPVAELLEFLDREEERLLRLPLERRRKRSSLPLPPRSLIVSNTTAA